MIEDNQHIAKERYAGMERLEMRGKGDIQHRS
jgi:hypothetical protein